MLRNYDRTDGDPEQYTVPEWMLPGTPGRRGFPDKPDIVILKGWPKANEHPLGPTNKSPEHGFTVKLIIAELKYTDDMNMHTKHAEIKEKYAPLVRALRTHGWQVHHEVASVVLGHRATALNRNKDAMQTLGITDKKNQQHTQNAMTDEAVRYTQIIVNNTMKKRATLNRRRNNALADHT